VHFENVGKRFETPSFMPVNCSNSVESVEWEIHLLEKQLNQRFSCRRANLHAVCEAKENAEMIEV
jgi:hypothetical protein